MSFIDQLDRLNAAEDSMLMAGPDEPLNGGMVDIEGEPVVANVRYWKLTGYYGDDDFIPNDPDIVSGWLSSHGYQADEYGNPYDVLRDDYNAELVKFDAWFTEQSVGEER
ncbi:hypothetical protein MUDAN_DOGOELCO_02539 [Lactiplantibacillus mudanjiangensis]|uniref:hypothetical protein n=1 Tax=Lactiplantibacillus mudanjiangensis TaxID=1296538 RepID=UPI001014DDF1|nr:hypothetical protein [Lactiplantibacillus mudanjiangensis]VDG33348.1 hypothetical protein MUDAN_DOGOELCO_02539 [Lactiplantibacillus mudanjiangensis]